MVVGLSNEDPSWTFYEGRLLRDYQTKTGTDFQTFFRDLMERCYGDQFLPVPPWGKEGDLKNDGFLKPGRILFQVYAPKRMVERTTVEKIEVDFTGALEHWKGYFDKWIFVHNQYEGLPPKAAQKILQLDNEHPDIEVGEWHYSSFRELLSKLKKEDLISRYGEAPPLKRRVSFAKLKVVVSSLSRKPLQSNGDLTPPSEEKIDANGLSERVVNFLKIGMRLSVQVERLFEKHFEPTLGDEIAQVFNEEYLRLKETVGTPDEIFFNLQKFARDQIGGDCEYESEILALLAYFFLHCDIFENLPKSA